MPPIGNMAQLMAILGEDGPPRDERSPQRKAGEPEVQAARLVDFWSKTGSLPPAKDRFPPGSLVKLNPALLEFWEMNLPEPGYPCLVVSADPNADPRLRLAGQRVTGSVYPYDMTIAVMASNGTKQMAINLLVDSRFYVPFAET